MTDNDQAADRSGFNETIVRHEFREGVHVMATQMAPDYTPPSMSLNPAAHVPAPAPAPAAPPSASSAAPAASSSAE